MGNIIQNIAGMGNMTEQIIASDALIAAKAGIKMYAQVLTETATPEVKEVLHRHLETAIETHSRITDYMIKKGYYFPYDPEHQMNVDMDAVNTFMNLQ
jgi:similar to spore coat protein